ncbi:unnamed protein product [Paramecium sonneborni]|uniref:Diacylglycerol kinase n=1 Tax=Paramecium sonneborni TaxID=65129 RepID=A0A8S1JXJ4_9CILI|nr:unnamed protein product [Paramecium sonneborni]
MEFAFFLFVNPTSGGNRAGVYLQLDAETIKFNLNQKPINVFFTSLHQKDQVEMNLRRIKEFQQRNVQVRVIVCGGDGTVMWVVDEMHKHSVDFKNCPIGIIPFGTGNDFSRVLGWGGDTDGDLGACLRNFKQQISQWLNAKIHDFDLWEINICVDMQTGSFKRIKKQGDLYQKEVLQKDKDVLKQLDKRMSNYFSIGVDARIGYGFDKKRTQSACCNKCVYFCEGLKKMCLKNPTTNQVISGMQILKEQNVTVEQINNIPTDILFKTKGANTREDQQPLNESKFILSGDPITLLCLNIQSYSGGAGAIWDNCRGKVAVKEGTQKLQDKFVPQDFGDGKIEFVGFNSMIGMANERFIHGNAVRIAQGEGPFLISFKKNVSPYFQIDGEYFQAVNPTFALLKKSSIRIKVLMKTQN